jgi:coniferyl-aldehyde dehydrogenase
VPLKDAAERIAFGKASTPGKPAWRPTTCWCRKTASALRRSLSPGGSRFYPTLADNPDYTAIINERQLARLNAYISDATSKGALLIPLFEQGQGRRMAHSLLLNVSDDMTVMQDEIFGPLLPIVPYQDLDQAFAYINQRPRPLALYYFGYDKARTKSRTPRNPFRRRVPERHPAARGPGRHALRRHRLRAWATTTATKVS